MGIEDRFCDAAALKQREAQQHCIPDARPERRAHIAVHADVLHQYRIDTDADHDEKRLKAQRKQGAQIVLSHLSPLAVDHGCHRDGRDRGDHVDFDHSPIGDDEDADAQRPGNDADQGGLEPKAKQRPDVHIREPGFDIAHQLVDVHRGVSDNHARRLIDHMLCHIKHAHDDVPGVRHDEHRGEGLEHPLQWHYPKGLIEALPYQRHKMEVWIDHSLQNQY